MNIEAKVENIDKALKRVDAFDEITKRKNVETVNSLKNKVFDPIDDKFQPENIRSESIDPRMLAYDAGIPQFFIKNCLFDCKDDYVEIGTGEISITNWSAETLSRWGIKELPREDYNPLKTWNFAATGIDYPSTGGCFAYSKVSLSPASTDFTIELNEDHVEAKRFIEDGFLYYKLGYITEEISGVRYAEMLWGNTKPASSPSSVVEDIAWDFNDVTTGVAQTYYLDVKASFGYNILSAVLQSDSTMDNMAVKINGTAITGLSAIDVTTAISDTAATAANEVVIDDQVTLVTSGTDGGATLIRGKIRIQRT